MTQTDFQAAVLAQYPTATFVTEDGSGLTYGEPGDTVAYVGPMQDDEDVVATLSRDGFAQIVMACRCARQPGCREHDGHDPG